MLRCVTHLSKRRCTANGGGGSGGARKRYAGDNTSFDHLLHPSRRKTFTTSSCCLRPRIFRVFSKTSSPPQEAGPSPETRQSAVELETPAIEDDPIADLHAQDGIDLESKPKLKSPPKPITDSIDIISTVSALFGQYNSQSRDAHLQSLEDSPPINKPKGYGRSETSLPTRPRGLAIPLPARKIAAELLPRAQREMVVQKMYQPVPERSKTVDRWKDFTREKLDRRYEEMVGKIYAGETQSIGMGKHQVQSIEKMLAEDRVLEIGKVVLFPRNVDWTGEVDVKHDATALLPVHSTTNADSLAAPEPLPVKKSGKQARRRSSKKGRKKSKITSTISALLPSTTLETSTDKLDTALQAGKRLHTRQQIRHQKTSTAILRTTTRPRIQSCPSISWKRGRSFSTTFTRYKSSTSKTFFADLPRATTPQSSNTLLSPDNPCPLPPQPSPIPDPYNSHIPPRDLSSKSRSYRRQVSKSAIINLPDALILNGIPEIEQCARTLHKLQIKVDELPQSMRNLSIEVKQLIREVRLVRAKVEKEDRVKVRKIAAYKGDEKVHFLHHREPWPVVAGGDEVVLPNGHGKRNGWKKKEEGEGLRMVQTVDPLAQGKLALLECASFNTVPNEAVVAVYQKAGIQSPTLNSVDLLEDLAVDARSVSEVDAGVKRIETDIPAVIEIIDEKIEPTPIEATFGRFETSQVQETESVGYQSTAEVKLPVIVENVKIDTAQDISQVSEQGVHLTLEHVNFEARESDATDEFSNTSDTEVTILKEELDMLNDTVSARVVERSPGPMTVETRRIMNGYMSTVAERDETSPEKESEVDLWDDVDKDDTTQYEIRASTTEHEGVFVGEFPNRVVSELVQEQQFDERRPSSPPSKMNPVNLDHEHTFFPTISNLWPGGDNQLPEIWQDKLMLPSRIHGGYLVTDVQWFQLAKQWLSRNINSPTADLDTILLQEISLESLSQHLVQRPGESVLSSVDKVVLRKRLNESGLTARRFKAKKRRWDQIGGKMILPTKPVGSMTESDLLEVIESSSTEMLIKVWQKISARTFSADSMVWASMLHRAVELGQPPGFDRATSVVTGHFILDGHGTTLLRLCGQILDTAVARHEGQLFGLFESVVQVLYAYIREWAASWKSNNSAEPVRSIKIPELHDLLSSLPEHYQSVVFETLLLKIVTPSPFRPDSTRRRWKIIVPDHLLHALINFVPHIQPQSLEYSDGNSHLRGYRSRLEDIVVWHGHVMTIEYLESKSDIFIASFFLQTWVRHRGWRYTHNDQAAFASLDATMLQIITKLQDRCKDAELLAKYPGLPYVKAILSIMCLEIPTKYFVSDILAALLSLGRIPHLLSTLELLSKSHYKPNITSQTFNNITRTLTSTHPEIALAILNSRPNRSHNSFSYFIQHHATTRPDLAIQAFKIFTSGPIPRIPDQKLLAAMCRQFANSPALTPRQAAQYVERCWKLSIKYKYPPDTRIGEALVWSTVIRYLFDSRKPGKESVLRHLRIAWAIEQLKKMATMEDLSRVALDGRERFGKRKRADAFLEKVRGLMRRYLEKRRGERIGSTSRRESRHGAGWGKMQKEEPLDEKIDT